MAVNQLVQRRGARAAFGHRVAQGREQLVVVEGVQQQILVGEDGGRGRLAVEGDPALGGEGGVLLGCRGGQAGGSAGT